MLDTPDLLTALRAIVGDAHVLTAPDRIAGFLIDVRRAYAGQALCIVEPASTDEVSAIVTFCAENGVPVTPIGGNTGLVGGAAVRGVVDADGHEIGAIGLSMRRMDRIRDISVLDATITVEAGCILQTIQQAAIEAGMFFPLSLSSEGSCQIGGNISTNAGGTAAIRYGMTRDIVLGLEVVLPSGKILNGLRRLRKDNTGYDIRQLFIGAEGTLGIITAAVLRLAPAARSIATAMVSVADVPQALEVLRMMRTTFGERVSSAEITERDYMDLVLEQVSGTRLPFDSPQPWYLLLEVADAREGVDLKTPLEETLEAALEQDLCADAVIAQNEAQAAMFWHLRHGVSEAIRHSGPNMSHDSSVPLERQGIYVEHTRERILARFSDARPLYVGHLGDGNMHLVVMFPKDRFADRAAYLEVSSVLDEIIDTVVMELEGSITAEHGIGLSYRQRLLRSSDPEEIALMQGIKRLFDPKNIMNPGKILQS